MKEMFNIWDAHVIFNLIKNKLEHENDGMIFTVDGAPYYMGQCHHILKWKPFHLNTIDFSVELLHQSPDINVWSLHTQKGDIFDFISMDSAQTQKYSDYIKSNGSCVLECNYERDASDIGIHLINQIKQEAEEEENK